MRKLLFACVALAVAAPTAFGALVADTTGRFLDRRDIGASAERTAVGDTFSATVVGFSDLGGAFLDDSTGGDPTFGGTSLIGNSVVVATDLFNITTTETPGPGAGETTLTFRIFTDDGLGGTPAFAPAGTTLGGDAVGALQWELGDFNAGLNLLDPGVPYSILSAGYDLFSDGGLVFGTALAIDPVAPGSSGVFSNGGAGLSILAAVSLSDGAGGLGDITAFGIDEAVITVVIPEPATLSLLGLGAVALIRRRRV